MKKEKLGAYQLCAYLIKDKGFTAYCSDGTTPWTGSNFSTAAPNRLYMVLCKGHKRVLWGVRSGPNGNAVVGLIGPTTHFTTGLYPSYEEEQAYNAIMSTNSAADLYRCLFHGKKLKERKPFKLYVPAWVTWAMSFVNGERRRAKQRAIDKEAQLRFLDECTKMGRRYPKLNYIYTLPRA